MRNRKRQFLPFLCLVTAADIASPQSITHPPLNSSALGQLALVGSFDSLSTFDYVGQNSVLAPVVANDNLLSQTADAWQFFLSDSFADATVQQACLLDNGIAIIAGNFTQLRGTSAQGIGRLDLNSGAVSSLGNISLTAAVNALWCNSTVAYVGGNLQLGNSQGIGIWNDSSSSWMLPAFGGFPLGSNVSSILPLTNDTILIGGHLGRPLSGISSTNTSSTQQVGLAAASASATYNNNNPNNVLCMSGDPYEATSGSTESVVEIDLGHTVFLSEITIANPNGSSDGTETFRLVTSPSNSIMNLSYVDEDETKYCDAYCPLRQGSATTFSFVNVVGTRNISLELLAYFGDHAALQGIEMFTSASFVYANNQLNAALDCQQVSTSAHTELQGDWQLADDYESVNITSGSALNDAFVKFYPNVSSSSGNYSLNLYTPGCLEHGTCDLRGQINVTVYPGPDMDAVSTVLYQTNNEIKFDPIYNGTLERTTSFNPYVEVKPVPGQQTPLEFVASFLQLQFETANSDVEIKNLFEYSVSNYSTFAQNSTFEPVGTTSLNALGASFGANAQVNALASLGETVFVGGNFSNSTIYAYDVSSGSTTSLDSHGTIHKFYNYDESLYAIQDSNSVYNVTAANLDEIYSKPVNSIVLFNLNGTAMLSFSFAGSTGQLDLYNLSSNSWYDRSAAISGHLSETLVYAQSNFYFGSLKVEQAQTPGAVSVSSDFGVSPLAFQFTSSNSSLNKRDDSISGNVINTGVFYQSANILGGHFTANCSDGNIAHNLLVVNGSTSSALNTDKLSESSVIQALAVHENLLVIAGSINGPNNAMAVYDLEAQDFVDQQPTNISGSIVAVQARGDSFVVFGEFSVDGCSNFCIYNVTSNSWATPKPIGGGTLHGATLWSGDEAVIYGEGLQVSGGSYSLVQYGFNADSYTPYTGTGITGNITGVTVGINDHSTKFMAVSWVNGSGHNINWFDGKTWTSSSTPLGNDSTISSISLLAVTGNGTNTSTPLGDNNVLAVNGALHLPSYGNATVASFDGTSWLPLFVTSQNGGQGSIAAMFSEKQVVVTNPSTVAPTPHDESIRKLMSKGRIVGISFAIAMGCICLVVLLGLLWGYFTQRKQFYQRAARGTSEKELSSAVPPEMIMAM